MKTITMLKLLITVLLLSIVAFFAYVNTDRSSSRQGPSSTNAEPVLRYDPIECRREFRRYLVLQGLSKENIDYTVRMILDAPSNSVPNHECGEPSSFETAETLTRMARGGEKKPENAAALEIRVEMERLWSKHKME